MNIVGAAHRYANFLQRLHQLPCPIETMFILLVIASVVLRTYGFTWCSKMSLLLLAELSPWIAIAATIRLIWTIAHIHITGIAMFSVKLCAITVCALTKCALWCLMWLIFGLCPWYAPLLTHELLVADLLLCVFRRKSDRGRQMCLLWLTFGLFLWWYWMPYLITYHITLLARMLIGRHLPRSCRRRPCGRGHYLFHRRQCRDSKSRYHAPALKWKRRKCFNRPSRPKRRRHHGKPRPAEV